MPTAQLTTTQTTHNALTFPVRLDAHDAIRGIEPVSFGIPLPCGAIDAGVDSAWLVSAEVVRLPAQVEPLAFWPDGTVRWALLDVLLTEECNGRKEWRVEFNSENDIEREHRIEVSAAGTGWQVATGTATFLVTPVADFLRTMKSESVNARVSLIDHKGRTHRPEFDGIEVLTSGPVRTTLELSGAFRKLRGLQVRLRLSFFAGTGTVRLEATLHNSRRARHPGGIWDLGDAGSHLFEEFSLVFGLPQGADGPIEYSTSANQKLSSTAQQSLSIYQDSSGGENWQSRAHVNRNGENRCRFRGCRIVADGTKSVEERVLPRVNVHRGDNRFSVAVPEFWQQFPMSITVDTGEVRLGLFPREYDDLHELQGGEQKSHTVWIDVNSSDVRPDALAWIFNPTAITPTSEWSASTGQTPELSFEPTSVSESFESILEESLEGERSIFANRERVDEYGWRNFGDIFADHEQAYYSDGEPLVSHYNNQFDMVQGFLLQYLRTGDRRWFQLGNELARHVIDIDIYHTQKDRAAYNGGLFWFTDHYLHAQTSTHRTYTRENRPASGGPYGGGPGAQHNFTTGLMLYHLLTGNRDARDAVIGLADWVMRMEDGRRTVFGLVDDGATGLATIGSDASNPPPGRAGGNSINALLDARLLTSNSKYIKFAESLIRRCIHPTDDVDSLDLLNVEKHWSYTVFLVALDKYLKAKESDGEIDEHYAYARDSLLNFAKWMLQNERPYYDQAEKLEFPTEAWAAQELRKANVFRLAARYAEEPLRSQLLERGDHFGDRAWSDLMRFKETRMYARAVAIVMTDGLQDCVSRHRTPSAAPNFAAVGHPTCRMPFVPQKQRVKSQLRSVSGAATIGLRLLNPFRWMKQTSHNQV